MQGFMGIVLGLAACCGSVTAAWIQDSPATPTAKVELRWVETTRVEGRTEDEGFQSSCDPNSVVYPHKAPALVLSAADVAEARLSHHDFSRSGLSSENYMVALVLTKDARDRLAASCGDHESRLLTVVVDGKCWGLHRYEKGGDKKLVPAQASAESFTPSIGFFSSKSEAERLVNAFK